MLRLRSSLLWVFVLCVFCASAEKVKHKKIKQSLAERHSMEKPPSPRFRKAKKAKKSKPGMPPFEAQPLIVGGTSVPGSEYPWMASLYIADPNCGVGVRMPHFCGGSIFDTTTKDMSWLLSAAHCLSYAPLAIDYYNYIYRGYFCEFALYADIGRDDADDPNESGFATLLMKDWSIHEAYDGTVANPFDVAIAWSFDQLPIAPVNLQTTPQCCANDDTVRALGYGQDIYNGMPTDTLEYVDLKFVDLPTCAALFDPIQYGLVQPGMVCAGDEGESICFGDSGGPLLHGTANDSPQVGIASWTYGCDVFGMPSGFADVGFHYNWIMSAKSAVADAEFFACDDGCMIPAAYVDDNYCDCGDCEDEANWDCESCRCPAFCGFAHNCGVFICNDGCVIPDFYEDDGYCDCGECEDESNWSCETCPGCPEYCGAYEYCDGFQFSTSWSPVNFTNFTTGFVCDDGCDIYDGYYDDGYCDCSECEDEPNWTCETCPGCPEYCGDYVSCYGTFVCNDGCQIPEYDYDDGYCDCAECEDEPNWTCETCPGCPEYCGYSVHCFTGFTCDDGCQISGGYYDDDFCDCTQCEDEPNWDCESCAGGCPMFCGAYEYCYGNSTGPTPTTTTTEGPLTTCIPDDGSKQKSFTYSSDEANCFPNIDSNIQDSGWTQSIGPLALDQSVDLYTISGAEDCQLCAARCDGRVTVTRRHDATGDWLQVVFAGNEANGVRFTKYFVWFGTSQLPLASNGQFTVNTNAFFCTDHSPGVGSVNYLLHCASPDADFSFDDAFYFIARSLTTGCDPTDEGQSFCADIFE